MFTPTAALSNNFNQTFCALYSVSLMEKLLCNFHSFVLFCLKSWSCYTDKKVLVTESLYKINVVRTRQLLS